MPATGTTLKRPTALQSNVTSDEGRGERHAGDGGPPGDRAPERSADRSLHRPGVGPAADLVADGLDRGTMVTLSGRCTVSYEGRASSETGSGTRHLILKPDGTLLVHDRDGHRPVNWLPPGGDLECRVAGGDDPDGAEDGELVVEGVRDGPDERVVVRFTAIHQAASLPVEPAPAPDVSGTEADLKQRVLDRPDLVEAGFRPLATERQTPAGAVDVYGRDDRGRTVVLELKRRRAGPDAVGQLERYVTALRRDLHADAAVRGILVAPSVTERASALLEEKGLEFVALKPGRE